jgi:tetrahedral aminopeptidase
MNIELFKELTEAHGVPGQEDMIRVIVKRELSPICDIRTDWMGNLICTKKSTTGNANAKKLMIAAHMDEIGFIVKYLGGWDPRQMAAQRVLIHTADGPINGVMMASVKPKHMLSPDDMGKALVVDNYFIDCGLSGEDAKKKIKLGDMVTMNRGFQQMGDLFTCKAMDDRAAVFVMIEAVKKAASHDVEVIAVATVQEEIGLRGATAAGSGLKPDLCVAIDVTLANDIPGLTEVDYITKLGEGTAIKFMDGSLLCHPKMVKHFREIAEKNNIKHQIEILPMGGTDAGGVQRQNGGIPAFTLSIPTRYIHTVNETVHKNDVQASIDILAKYIEDAHNGNYSYE